MANKTISALTGASTPVAGTEVLPIVQGGATVKVAISNLTAGRAVSALSLDTTAGITSSYTYSNGGANWAVKLPAALGGDDGYASNLLGETTIGNAYYKGAGQSINPVGTTASLVTAGPSGIYFFTDSGLTANTPFTPSLRVSINAAGQLRILNDNLLISTAAKGVNFTANTPAAGMTSQLLNWYEEGTWTPNQGGGLTVIGAFTSSGKYTRIGRNVIVSGTVTGATSVALAAAGIITTNLPFTVGTAGHGNITNAALTSFAAIICATTNLTSAGAIAATGTLTFSATYFV